MAHEMGHQFGANHTFNSTAGSCSGNRNASTAFEPGSGVTIMAYAGICSTDDLQPHSDPYFHGGSLDEIQTFLAGSGGGCAVTSTTGNNAPTVSGGLYLEEMDAGAAASLATADNGSMALFGIFHRPTVRSVIFQTDQRAREHELEPGEAANDQSHDEISRDGRDNRVGGGGVADAQITVTSVSGAGAFAVTSPNTAVNWSGVRTVTWNVAGSASAPITPPA